MAVLLVLAGLLRLTFVWAVPRVLDSADAVHYLRAAGEMAHGDFLTVDPKIPVLYPAFVAIASYLTHDLEGAGRLVSFLFSSLLVVPVYFLSRDLHGRGPARVAGVTVAVWPWLIDYGSRVATEATAVFFWVAAVALFLRGMRVDRSAGWMLASAFAFTALHLARPEGTFVLLGALGAGVVLAWSNPRYRLSRLGVYAGVCAVLFVIHAAYLHALVGRWTVNYRVGFIGDQPEGSTIWSDLAKTVVALSSDVPAVMLGPVLWVFAGVGFVLPGDRPRNIRAEAAVLYFVCLQWLVTLPVLSPAPRYLMAVFVALTLWSARGVEQTSLLIAARARRAWLRAVPLALVVGFMGFHLAVAIGAERIGRDVPEQPREYKVAGEWMRDHLEPGLVMTRKPQVAFYAGMDSAGPPLDATLDQIIDLARRGGFAYLVVDERYTAQLIPALRPLLDPSKAPPQLRLLRADLSPYPEARIVIYSFDAADRPGRIAQTNRAGVGG